MSNQTTFDKIAKEMTIESILSSFPSKSQKLAQALTKAGLNCVGCGAATWETLEAGMLSHGMSEADITKLVAKLNDILSEPLADTNSINLTPKAAEKFLEILEEEGRAGWALRFGDQPGGCSGYEYVLDFSEVAESDDDVFSSHGVDIHVNKKMVKRLMGCEIDYSEGLHGGGFKISNPNAKGTCGCGSSQSY